MLRWNQIHKITLLALNLFALTSFGGQEGRLELSKERSLYYQSESGMILIKALPSSDQEFQGYALLKGGEIFLAYSTYDGDAGTTLSVFSLKDKHEHIIIELGGIGGSTFSYNGTNGLVVFNWYDGIYVFVLDKAVAIPNGPDKIQIFKKSVQLAKKCVGCFDPTWSSPTTILYQQRDLKGVARTERIDLGSIRR